MSKQSISLAPLPGAVCAQWRRCGKPNCRCRYGKPHGPYHYRFWREAGRLRKEYVPPDRLEAVLAALVRYRQMRADLRFGRWLWSKASRRSRELILVARAEHRP